MNADHIMSWALFESEFLIIWRMSFLENWQLGNKFSVSKVDCDRNTLLLGKKSSGFHYFLKNNNKVFVKKLLSWKLIIVSNILKAKESPRLTFTRTKRVSQPEFSEKDLYINMIMSYLEIKIFFHKLVDFEKKLVTFSLFNSCLFISRNDP